MADNKKYYVQFAGDSEGMVWDADRYARNREQLFKDHPDVSVTEMSAYDPKDSSDDSDSSYYVQFAGDSEGKEWDADRFNRNKEQLLKDHPDVQVTRLRIDDPYAAQLDEQNKRIDELTQRYRDVQNKSLQTTTVPQFYDTPNAKKNAGIISEVAQKALEAAGERPAIKNELDKAYKERENNPRYQQDKKRTIDFLTQERDRIEQMRKETDKGAAEWAALESAYLNYNDALKKAKAPSKYDDLIGIVNMWKGTKENGRGAVSLLELAKAGVDKTVINAISKIQAEQGDNADIIAASMSAKPEYLSDNEMEALKAFVIKQSIDAGRAGDLSLGYQAGEGFVKSLGFMGDFIVSRGVASAVGRKLAKTAIGTTAKEIANLAPRAVAKASSSLGLTGTKRAIAQSLPKFALGTLKNAGQAAVLSPLMPSFYTNIEQNMLELDKETGSVDLSAEKWRNAILDSYIENFSELAGNQVGAILGAPFSAGAKMADKIFKTAKFSQLGRLISGSYAGKILKQGAFDGLAGEMGEEWYGNAIRYITGIDTDALKDFATVDQQIITLTSFAPTIMLGVGASVAQKRFTDRCVERSKNTLTSILAQNGYSQESIQNIIDMTGVDTPAQIGEKLTPVINQVARDNGKASRVHKAALDYARAIARQKTLGGIEEADAEIKRAGMQSQISQALGENVNWYHNTEGGEMVRTIDDAEGNTYYVASQDENGVMTVGQDGQNRIFSNDELASGQYNDSGEMMLRDYLDMRLSAKNSTEQLARMQSEEASQMVSVKNSLPIGTIVNIGTVETPVQGQVVQQTAGGVIIMGEDGSANEYDWRSAGQLIGRPIVVKTDEQIADDEASEMLSGTDIQEKLNGEFPGWEFSFNGQNYLFGRAMTLPGVDEDGINRIVVMADNAETGENEEIEIPVDEIISQMPQDAIAEDNQSAQEKVNASTGQLINVDDVAKDLQGNPLPMRVNASGERVVDDKTLWNNDPRSWSAWNDSLPVEQRRMDSPQFIELQKQKVDKDIEKIRKQIEKEYVGAWDQNKIDSWEAQAAQMVQRSALLDSILYEYAEAAKKAKQAEIAAAHKEELDNQEPRSIIEVASAFFRSLKFNGNLDHSIDRDEVRRETGWGNTELNLFFQWWAPSGQGLSINDLAEQLCEFDGQYGFIPNDSNAEIKDEQIARDAIIELLRSSSKPSDVYNYVVSENEQRKEDEKAYYEAEAQRIADQETTETVPESEEIIPDTTESVPEETENVPETVETVPVEEVAQEETPEPVTEEREPQQTVSQVMEQIRSGVAQAAGDANEIVRARTKDWTEKTGVSVIPIESPEEILDDTIRDAVANNGATGWYQNGNVFIYIPNCAKAIDPQAEVDKTFIHEVVSHNGLRGLLGEDKYNSLLDDVFSGMDEASRAKFLDYVSYLRGSEQDKQRAAADEYIANLAENLNPENASAWEQIVAKVKEVLAKMGLLHNVTNADLSALLVASYQNLIKTNAENKAKGEAKAHDNKTAASVATTGNKPSRAIEDAGEKIAGARKDMLRDLAKTMDNVSIQALVANPFAKVFKKPNFAKLVETGAIREKDALVGEAICQALISASKPKADTKKDRMRRRMTGVSDVERWANAIFKGITTLNDFLKLSEDEKDEFIQNLAPVSEESIAEADIKTREMRRWNSDNTIDRLPTPDPVYVAIKVLDGLGYKSGMKVDIIPTIRGAVNRYEARSTKTGKYISSYSSNLDEAIIEAICDVKLSMGLDADIPMNDIYTRSDRRVETGEIAGYRVGFMSRGSVSTKDFESKEDADKFVETLKAKNDQYSTTEIKETRPTDFYFGAYDSINSDCIRCKDLKFDTADEAKQYLADHYDEVVSLINAENAKAKGAESEAKKEHIYVSHVWGTGAGNYAIIYDDPVVKKQSGGLNDWIPLKEFKTREEANRYLAEHKDELVAPFEKLKEDLRNFVFFEGERPYKSKDWREGKDVTAEQFIEKFGFRGVQFGNWTNDKDRQMALNRAYDSFMNLADILSWNPRALSLNGELGIAFGARGSGSALAHYEPSEVVINLTKTRGAGSLAHEWIHALDNYFSRMNNDKAGMISANYNMYRETLRPEVFEAMRNLVDQIRESDYGKRSKSNGAYWRREWEMLARLFAEYVNDTLESQGNSDSFLSRGIDPEKFDAIRGLTYAFYVNKMKNRTDSEGKPLPIKPYEVWLSTESNTLGGYPFPTKEETKELTPALEEFLKSIEMKEGENGRIILFRKAPNGKVPNLNDQGNVIPLSERFSESDDIRFRLANQNQLGFVSNAAKAVEAVKMDKATPEQWKAMIAKEGGMKAGEDKWMGLSDWLDSSDKKTLTKDEVLKFVNENAVQIEETRYAESWDESFRKELDDKFGEGVTYAFDFDTDPMDDLHQVVSPIGKESKDFYNRTHTDNPLKYDDYGDLTEDSEETLNEFVRGIENYLNVGNGMRTINGTRLDYTTKGLENKREIALSVPTIESWNETDETHFGDAGQGRAIAWSRFGETTDADGNRVLVIDEIQSKRHQEGREKGYLTKDAIEEIKQLNEKIDLASHRFNIARDEVNSYQDKLNEKYGGRARYSELSEEEQVELARLTYNKQEQESEYRRLVQEKNKFAGGVPAAPFEKNWHELAMKRMLRLAAEEGYDKLAWTNGATQARRYALSEKIDDFYYKQNEDGTYKVSAIANVSRGHGEGRYDDFKEFKYDSLDEKQLAEYFGKDVANQIISGKGRKGYSHNEEVGWTTFKGKDIELGGEGMKVFYDKMLPTFMDKYCKKWGAKTQDIDLPGLKNENGWHSVDITPEMKQSVLNEGQVMFRKTIQDTDPSSEENVRFRKVTDTELLNKLNSEPTITVYRAMQLIDGKLYPPMSAYIDGELREPTDYDSWGMSEENPELADENGNFKLEKGRDDNGKNSSVPARYNPYFHTSFTPLNDQFSAAQTRSNLVIVRCEVPESELTSGYKAEKAKDSVGEKDWHSGPLSGVLAQYDGKKRRVVLSRYAKVTGIVPVSEIADIAVDLFKGTTLMNNPLPTNVMTKDLRDELEKRGFSFIETTNDGNIVGDDQGRTWAQVYGKNALGKKPKESKSGKVSFRKKSENRLSREKYEDSYINVAGLILGGKKEGAKYYREQINKRKEQATELYSRVLNNQFDDVTLRLINEYIDNATPKNPYGRRISKRVPQEMERSLYEGERNNAVDALFSRISEGAVEKTARGSKEGRRRIAETKKESLKGWAIASGNWHTSIEDFVSDTEKIGSGKDSDVYYSKDPDKVIKVSKGKNEEKRFSPDIDAVNLFNFVFPNMAYAIKGYGEIDGKFVKFLEQQAVGANKEETVSMQERLDYMAGLGFRPINKENTLFTNDNLVVADLQKANIVKGETGNIRVIDADVKLHTPDIGGKYTYPDYETDIIEDNDVPDAEQEPIVESLQEEKNTTDSPRFRFANHDAVAKDGLASIVGPGYSAMMREILNSMPSGMKRSVMESALNGRVDFPAATAEKLAEIAGKAEHTEEEKNVLDNAIGILRTKLPSDSFEDNDAKWMFYQNVYGDNIDMLQQVYKSRVAHRLGMSGRAKQIRDKAEEELRFRKADSVANDSAARLYNNAMRNVRTRLKEDWVDQYEAINKLVDAIEQSTGKAAKAFEDIRLDMNQLSSRGLAEVTKWYNRYFFPMITAIHEIMKVAGVDIDNIERYTMFKHGLERNEKFAKRDARNTINNYYDSKVGKIKADSKIDDETRARKIEKLDAWKEEKMQEIEAGTNKIYLQNRERDYSGIVSMFSTYDEYDDRREGESEEEFQARVLAARHPMYETLAEAEAAAASEVSKFENKAGKDNIAELWNRINAANKGTLKHQYESNMLTKAQYEHVAGMFDYYVPLRGFKENTAENMYDYYNSDQRGTFTPPLLRAIGRKTEADSPLGYIGAIAGSAIAADMKNRAKLSLYYFVSNRPDNDLVTVGDVWYQIDENNSTDESKVFVPVYPEFTENGNTLEEYKEFEKKMRGLEKEGKAHRRTNKLDLKGSIVNIEESHKDKHIVKFKIGGIDKFLIVNGNPRAAQAVNGELSLEGNAGDLTKATMKILRELSALNTSYNPEFWISNLQRDMLYSLMATSVKEDAEYARAFRKNIGISVKAFTSGQIIKKYSEGTLGDSAIEQYYREFNENGGITGWTKIKDNEEWEFEIRNATGDDKVALEKTKGILTAAQNIGESIEQITRFAAYITSRESGRDVKRSVADAKEISVNFNRKGSGKAITMKEAENLRNSNGEPLNKVEKLLVVGLSSIPAYGRRAIMFFNASIQGLYNYYNLWKVDKRRATVWAAGFTAVGAMIAAANYLAFSLLFGDDDDKYLDNPDYERRNNILLGAAGCYFKWALPQEARAFYALGDIAVEHALRRSPDKKWYNELAEAISGILPIDVNNGIRGIVPSYITPIIELAQNKNYMDQQIYSDSKYLSDGEKKRTPKYDLAKRDTWSGYINMSKLLNYISGGDKYDAGLINISPEVFGHLVEGYTGGLGTTVEKMIHTASGIVGADEFMVRNIPFLRRLLVVTDERYRNAHTTDLYNFYTDEAEHTKKVLKQAKENGDNDVINKLYESGDVTVMNIVDSYSDKMKFYNELIKNTSDKSERRKLVSEQDEYRKMMNDEISKVKQ